jgi:hypothetical protein
MCYTRNELKAMLRIAEKMCWHKPVSETIEIINQMVMNQQALMLDTIGEHDSYEETLTAIAEYDVDKLVSTMYVSSYQDLVMWGVYCFCDDMGITPEDFSAMLTWHSVKDNLLAPEYEAEDNFARLASEYNDADWEEFTTWSRESWIRNNCY